MNSTEECDDLFTRGLLCVAGYALKSTKRKTRSIFFASGAIMDVCLKSHVMSATRGYD